MVTFSTNVSESEIAGAFKSPASGSTIDTDLVNHLLTLPKGGAIKLPKDDSITDRSLKVRVNKAAKAANRKLEWAEVSDGYIARVVLITAATSTNGAVASAETPAETPVDTGATDEATPTRNRR